MLEELSGKVIEPKQEKPPTLKELMDSYYEEKDDLEISDSSSSVG